MVARGLRNRTQLAERCQRLERRVAELEDELRAHRAAAQRPQADILAAEDARPEQRTERHRDQIQVLSDILEDTLAGYWDWNILAGTEYLSPAFKKMFGYEDHELPNRPESWQRLIFPEDLPRVREGYGRHVETRGRYPYRNQVRYRHKDGSTVWVLCAGRVIEWADDGSPVRMVGCHVDITERWQTEQALRASEERYRQLVEISPDLIAIHQRGEFVFINAAGAAMLGASSPEEIVGRNITYFVASGRIAQSETHLQQLIAAGRRLPRYEQRLRRLDGTELEVEVTGAPFTHEGQPAVQVVAHDVSRRKRSEEALRESLQMSADIILAIPSGLFIYQHEPPDGLRLISANPEAERLTGICAAEAVGRPFDEIWPEAKRLGITASFVRVMQTGEPFETEELQYADDRLTGAFRVRVFALPQRRLAVAFDNITERKRAEQERERLREQLHHAQKMEAIGRLAAGVAHDFNNMLGGLLGGLEVLQLELGEAALAHREDFDDLRALVRRGSQLTRQLLGLGRRGKYNARPLELPRAVRDTSAVFARTHRHVTVELDFPEDLPPVLMDHAQLEQVLLNLFLNAGQAMRHGGRLTIRAEQITLAEEQAAAQGIAAGRFVRLDVIDTGTGMDAETKARVFEPFFTTKPAGQGSGLGLASAFGIVKNHGGAMSVESEPGRGATFTVVLPATDRPAALQAPASDEAHVGHGTILVVDDEPKLRTVTAQMLGACGYDVLTAGSGREAVQLVKERSDELSLVLLDMTMPEMSGARAYELIRELAPNLKVLLSSGFSADGQARELLERGCSDFIQKPFDLAQLSAKIRRLL